MQITDELRVIIEAEVDRAIRDMDKWDKSVDGTTKKLEDLEAATNKISNRLMLVSGAFTAVGAAGLKFYADLEDSRTAFEVLIGDADKAAKTLAKVQEYSQKTSYSSRNIEDAAIQLMNYQIAADEVTEHLKMIGDVSMGNAAKMESVTRAYGRIQLKGKASMEELNMLTEAGVPILAKLAENAGVSAEELIKMATDGRISADMVVRAFQDMTNEGGQFADMAAKQSSTLKGMLSTVLDQASMALAKVIEPLVPTIKDLLAEVGKVAEAFGRMDEGAKKALISLLVIGAAAGPISKTASAAIGLVKGIMGLASMNPAVLGIMAVVGALSLLTGALIDAKLNAKSFKEGLDAFQKGQQDALAASKTYEDMRATLPSLTREMYDAAKATGKFNDAVAEAEKLQTMRSELAMLERDVAEKSKNMQDYLGSLKDALAEPINVNAKNWWEGPSTAAEKLVKVQDAIKGLDGNMQRILRESSEFKAAFDERNFEGMLKVVESLDAADPKIKARIDQLKRDIEKIASGATITPKITLPATSEMKKTWQDWWQEITGVDKTAFNTGAEAAKIYLDGLASELQYAEAIGVALGEKIDPIPYLQKQQEEIKKTLIELLKISPDDIDEVFQFGFEFDSKGNEKMDTSIKALIARYKELSQAISQAEQERKKLAEAEELSRRAADLLKTIETPLDRYKATLAEIDEIWRSQEYEGQLITEEQLLKLTAAAADQYRNELRAIDEAQNSIRKDSFEEWLRELTLEYLQNAIASRDLSYAIAEVGTQIAMVNINNMVDEFKELGQAWADGAISADEWGDALAGIAKQILDMLPMLFVQAGLQLIAANPVANWAIGLGFIMGGISTAIIAGLNEGLVENAKGNVFDAGAIVPFAKGGAFTNSIVSRATRFNIGEMGESGPEAIVPLHRMSDGSLGVASTGSSGPSANVTNINVINYTGKPVQTKESINGATKDIEIIVGGITEKLISEGRFDNANQGRYGLGKRAVRG